VGAGIQCRHSIQYFQELVRDRLAVLPGVLDRRHAPYSGTSTCRHVRRHKYRAPQSQSDRHLPQRRLPFSRTFGRLRVRPAPYSPDCLSPASARPVSRVTPSVENPSLSQTKPLTPRAA
jgi:hypothetical protein